ncbi:hypothetical protein E1K68_10545 [Pseudomonas sp. B2021]|nr:hypothetical protein [Pseudomonas sp. B2021]OWQ40142.1 hypothetical protein CDH05_18420 [Pseudomonas lactis]TKJ97689.1 hypothetical protein PflCFBP13510_26050 [Pseudomonas fluorescens]TKK39448.1 hypothetical protein PflCFBP13517_21995 [Pseudomonas fluorescens]
MNDRREAKQVSLWRGARQPTLIYQTPRNPTVGAGLPAMAACQPTLLYLTPYDPIVGAGLLAKAACQPTPGIRPSTYSFLR